MLNKINLSPELETTEILKLTIKVSRELAEYKILVNTFTSFDLLFNLVNLIDAKSNLELEGKHTNFDNIFWESISIDSKDDNAKKAIILLKSLRHGGYQLHENKLLTMRTLVDLQVILENNKAGLRKIPGQRVWDKDGNVIYFPPKMFDEVHEYMRDYEKVSNDPFLSDLDPLLKQALLHMQLIAIQPFIESSNEMSRLITSLYFTKEKLLINPIFAISSFLVSNKKKYEQFILNAKLNEKPSDWIEFYLNAIYESVKKLKSFINELDQILRNQNKLIYNETSFHSTKLRNLIIKYPISNIKLLIKELNIHRQTASSYLNTLTEIGILKKNKIGRNNIYENTEVLNLIKNFNINIII